MDFENNTTLPKLQVLQATDRTVLMHCWLLNAMVASSWGKLVIGTHSGWTVTFGIRQQLIAKPKFWMVRKLSWTMNWPQAMFIPVLFSSGTGMSGIANSVSRRGLGRGRPSVPARGRLTPSEKSGGRRRLWQWKDEPQLVFCKLLHRPFINRYLYLGSHWMSFEEGRFMLQYSWFLFLAPIFGRTAAASNRLTHFLFITSRDKFEHVMTINVIIGRERERGEGEREKEREKERERGREREREGGGERERERGREGEGERGGERESERGRERERASEGGRERSNTSGCNVLTTDPDLFFYGSIFNRKTVFSNW